MAGIRLAWPVASKRTRNATTSPATASTLRPVEHAYLASKKSASSTLRITCTDTMPLA
jgi:hypothetical protein